MHIRCLLTCQSVSHLDSTTSLQIRNSTSYRESSVPVVAIHCSCCSRRSPTVEAWCSVWCMNGRAGLWGQGCSSYLDPVVYTESKSGYSKLDMWYRNRTNINTWHIILFFLYPNPTRGKKYYLHICTYIHSHATRFHPKRLLLEDRQEIGDWLRDRFYYTYIHVTGSFGHLIKSAFSNISHTYFFLSNLQLLSIPTMPNSI